MNARHTVLRSLHDLGLAAWSGGALMGAVGLNGAAANARDPRARPRIAADGWARWSPVTAWSGALGRQVQQHAGEGAHGSTEPAASSSEDLASAQRQLRVTQWAIPALTGVLVVLTAHRGELQRPSQQLRGRIRQQLR